MDRKSGAGTQTQSRDAPPGAQELPGTQNQSSNREMISLGNLSGTSLSVRSQIVPYLSRASERPRAEFASVIRLPALVTCLVAFLLLNSVERRCWGQSSPILAVERQLGAEGCPDVDALTSRVERIRGRAADDVKGGYQITFAHDADAFSATIRSGPDGTGVRTLQDQGATCAALAQATAVTLALLLDSDAPPPDQPTPPPPPPSPPPAPKTPAAPVAAVVIPERSPVFATLALGGAALVGVIQPVAPALSGEAGVGIARWHMGLGALIGLPQDISLGPGTVRESLLSGFARICYAPWRDDSFAIDACSGGYFGRLAAEGRNYTNNTQQIRTWVAAPFEVAATYRIGAIGVQLAATALVPVQRQNFSIEHLGVAYEATPIAAMFSLRITGRSKL